MSQNQISKRSCRVFYDNINWLLYSGIRAKHGPDRGAVYGWKMLKPPTYPFVYNEIVGYAITAFCWMYHELGDPVALRAAKDCLYWIKNNILPTNLLVAGRAQISNFTEKGDLSNLIYSFDNGMIIIGIINLYKVTGDSNLVVIAERMAQALIDKFFDGSKLIAVLDKALRPVRFNGRISLKWSSIPGAYHCKLSMGLLELSKLTNKSVYRTVSNSICNFASTLQESDGRFVTGPGSMITFLHPHLYACEGLIYSGITQSNKKHHNMGIKGIKWAIKIMLNNGGILPRHSAEKKIDQSDCISQLLRLSILCRSALLEGNEFSRNSLVDTIIMNLHLRLLRFHIPLGEDKGGMRYNFALQSACSWCTMFSMQAIRLWDRYRHRKIEWIDGYI